MFLRNEMMYFIEYFAEQKWNTALKIVLSNC